jgi:hypothetical protein
MFSAKKNKKQQLINQTMSTRAEVQAKVISHNTYLGSAVKQLINEVVCETSIAPNQLKKGDVIKSYVGVKSRPSVIIKIQADFVISIPLSSTENVHNLCTSQSRFFGQGWFCNQYTLTPTQLALDNFIGVYDNNKELNNAIKELRLFVVKNV